MPTQIDPQNMPSGEYAVVEALGHRTLVGRVSEVERFGVKMLSVEPFFQDWMLDPVLLGGQSIYQFTPCSANAAWGRRAKYEYELQGGLSATVADLLSPPEFMPAFLLPDIDSDRREDDLGGNRRSSPPPQRGK